MDMCKGDYKQLNFTMLKNADEKGDDIVHSALQVAARRLTIGLSNMVCALSCYNIVLGGGIEKLGSEFLSMIQKEVGNLGFRKAMRKVQVSYTTLHNDAECLGISEYYIDNILQF